MSNDFYGNHLAKIHDEYFGDLAENAGHHILPLIQGEQRSVIDIGCGSGILAAILSNNGHNVVGVDISADILEIAKRRAPKATFIQESLYNFDFEVCDVVTAIGEPINYLFDDKSNQQSLSALFAKVYRNLRQGGLFVLDFLTTDIQLTATSRLFEKEDMVMFVSTSIDASVSTLTRSMTYFIKKGKTYIRDCEVHKQRLLDANRIYKDLLSSGFEIEKIDGYSGHPFRQGHVGFLCKKISG